MIEGENRINSNRMNLNEVTSNLANRPIETLLSTLKQYLCEQSIGGWIYSVEKNQRRSCYELKPMEQLTNHGTKAHLILTKYAPSTD